MLVSYWLTNIAGIAIMVASGARAFAGPGKTVLRFLLELAGTIVVYSFVLILLNLFGLLKPLAW